jgi:hypothetical protein
MSEDEGHSDDDDDDDDDAGVLVSISEMLSEKYSRVPVNYCVKWTCQVHPANPAQANPRDTVLSLSLPLSVRHPDTTVLTRVAGLMCNQVSRST